MIKRCLFIILIFLLASLVLAEEKEIILGGDAGWNAFSVSKNIALSDSGRFGKQAIQIDTNSEKNTYETDLLLDFEQNGAFVDMSGNYTTTASYLSSTSHSIMGKKAAIGMGNSGGIQLEGKQSSIFGKQGLTGSFTISFWLNPSLVENGETIFLWDSSRNVNNVPIYQLISVMFFQNRLEWNFTNIFSHFTEFKDITIRSTNLVIPDTWAYHSISYNESTGLIEYRIDGKLESLTYATKSGWAERNVYSAILGTVSEVNICSNYTGRIDDFSITKSFSLGNFENNRYNPTGGYFETQPLGPFPLGSYVTGIETITQTPPQTDVQFFVRAGDNFYEWNDNYPEWIPISDLTDTNAIQGKFFQLAAFLYTDGNGAYTPTVTEIRLSYNEAEPPLPPTKIFAKAENGYVDLSWLPAAGKAPDGYIVYYGNTPNEYLGEGALQGDSPIDVGQTDSFRISGLQNGKAYYFAVSAYSYTPTKTEGPLSNEIYARPLKGGL